MKSKSLLLMMLLALVSSGAWAQTIYSGFTATAGTQSNSGEGYALLVDGNYNTSSNKWCTTLNSPSYIEFNYSSAITPTGYILTTGGDTETYTGRNPKNWKLMARANTSDSWTLLTEVTDDKVMQTTNLTSYEFNLYGNNTAYKYYRFEVSAVVSGNILQLAELRLKNESCPTPTIVAKDINATGATLYLYKGASSSCTLQYGTNSSFTSGSYTEEVVSGSTNTKTLTGLTTGITYYARMKSSCSSWGATCSFVPRNTAEITLNANITQELSSTTLYNFYDSGGSSSNYSNSENYTATFTSDGEITINFSSFVTESTSNCSDWDYMYIYDGDTQIVKGQTGCSSAALTTNTDYTATSGTMKITWKSDGGTNAAGWAATITTTGGGGGGGGGDTPSGTELTVADGTGTNATIPFYGTYTDDNYQHTQTIYPSSMLTDMVGGQITKLTYYANDTETEDYGSTFQVRIGTTTTSSFANSSSASYLDPANLTQVYSNTLSVNGTTVVFDFSDSPFTYSRDNLVVDVRITALGDGFNGISFKGNSGGEIYYSIQNKSTDAVPTTGTTTQFMPKTTFTYTPAASPAQTFITEIANETDWEAFCDAVNGGHDYYGETVTMTDNVTTAVTTMAGTSSNPFKGTFDGQGHTLNVNLSSSTEGFVAPFHYVTGATIKNLKVTGSCVSSVSGNTRRHNAGLVGSVVATGVTVENCLVTANVGSTSYRTDYCGGLIGHGHDGNITIIGSAYTGTLYVSGTNVVGGLLGWADTPSGVTITDCFFGGTYNNSSSGGYFHPVGVANSANNINSANISISNCYYTTDPSDFSSTNTDKPIVVNSSNKGKHAYTITAGSNVTVANAGTATTYGGSTTSVHYITGYGTGIKYNDVLYAGQNDNVSLTLNYSGTIPSGQELSGYTASNSGTLTGSGSSYTLTMPNNDTEISANITAIKYKIATYVSDTTMTWADFVANINGGETYSGKTIELEENITVSTTAGNNDHRFCGTFEGNGYTLNLNLSSSEGRCAPFNATQNATFQNLVIAGNINTSTSGAAGLIGYVYGSCTITNCLSKVTLTSTFEGKGADGGFIGEVGGDGSVIFNGCAFTGSLLGSSTKGCGGFVGWTSAHFSHWGTSGNATIVFNNCLFAPESVTMDPSYWDNYAANTPSASFARSFANSSSYTNSESYTQNYHGLTFNNCYYTQAFGTPQGEQAYSVTPVSPATVAMSGTASPSYDVSGLGFYTNSFTLANSSTTTIYAKGDATLSLTLSGSTTGNYEADHGTLTGSGNSWSLVMEAYNTEISALACYPLSNLSANGATITWDGDDASYIVELGESTTTTGTTEVLNEGFEGGSLPTGWSNSTYSGTQWEIGTGTGHTSSSYPATTSAATGNYNVKYYTSTTANSAYLITPVLDLSNATEATLTFNYTNPAWSGGIFALTIYYRVNGGEWQQLVSYTSAQNTWTGKTVTLQGLAANYQIGFYVTSYNNDYGHGVGIDDVVVTKTGPVTTTVWTPITDNATSPYSLTEDLTACEEYTIRVVSQCGQVSNEVTFEMPCTYTLTTLVNTEGAGSVTCDPAGNNGVYDYNTPVQLTASANAGYSFVDWTVDGTTVTGNPTTVTMTQDHNVVANFNQIEYTLTLNVNAGIGGTVSATPAGPYHYGDEVTIKATANDGYTFGSWSDSGAAEHTVTITGNATYTATFTQNDYTLTINYVYQNGTTAATSHSETLHYNDHYSVTSPVIEGYTADLTTVSGDMPADDRTITVTYTINTYTIRVFTNDQSNSSVNLSVDGTPVVGNTAIVNYNQTVKATATLNGNYGLDSWTRGQNGQEITSDNPYEFSATESIDLWAHVSYWGVPPTVVTNTVTNITETQADCSGNVTADGGSTVTERGFCWATNEEPTINGSYVRLGEGTGAYATSGVNVIKNLTPNTKYYVRAYAKNRNGVAYGTAQQFTSLAAVTTAEAADVHTIDATLGGSWTSTSESITSCGVVYSITNATPTLGGDGCLSQQASSTSTPFTVVVTGLKDETSYFARAYVTNAGGTSYGAVKTFTTLRYYRVAAIPSPAEGGTISFSREGDGDGGDATPVKVGNGSGTTPHLPFASLQNYSFNQMIYLASEINKQGTIKSITFFKNENTSNPLNYEIEIYMKHVSRFSFTTTNEWEDISEADLCFSGRLEAPAKGTNASVTITLDNAFEYDGESNLLVAFNEKSIGNSGAVYWYKTDAANTCIVRAGTDALTPTSASAMTGTILATRPNIELSIVAANSGTQWYSYGSTTTLTATPSEGYVFSHWTENNVNVGTSAEYELSNITDDHELTAHFVNCKHFVTAGNWNVGSNWEPAGVPDEHIDVAIDAAATIPSDVVAKAKDIVSISEGASITIEDGGQLWHSNSGVNVTIKKNVKGYGEDYITTNMGYTLLSTPVTTSHSGIVTESPYDWYYFDYDNVENGNLLEWVHETTPTFMRGYIYANQGDTQISVTGTATRSDTTYQSGELAFGGDYRFNGWNLVGNPFVCNAYVTRSNEEINYYVLKHNSEAGFDEFLLAESQDSIAPMEALMVKATAAKQHITYSRTRPSRGTGILNIDVNKAMDRGTTLLDRARVRFGEGEGLEKFQFNPNHTKVYIPQESKDFAVVYAEGAGTIPVNFKAQDNGRYTLSISTEDVGFNYLHLIDNMNGNDVDLLQTPYYTFDAKSTDFASRFTLVFATGNDNDDTFAFFNNGVWIINNDGKATLQVVDALGRVLSSETISGSCSKAINVAPGVYMLRLINGDDVKVQKIVVRR